jgi:S1-C subfamily serine protease
VEIQPADSATEPAQPERSRRFLRGRAFRLVAAVAALVVVVAVAASLAFARIDTAPIGAGVVVIDTNLGYEGGAAAGTGIVLTSSGEILTNNHVIRGATSIKVVVPGTGRSYSATVVGYDLKDDVAVIKARGASSLKTAALGNSSTLAMGSTVLARGNAGGTGVLTSATGSVTGLNRSITVSDDSGGSEQLSGLIETNAGVQPGDSGGPLYNSAHRVVGIDTAAGQGYGYGEEAATDAYAIPINRALAIARQIESGKSSAAVHIGGTAFLGVAVQQAESYGGFGDAAGGAVVEVLPGSPAAAAGLAVGDVITSIGGRQVATSTTIAGVLQTRKPGSRIALSYVDQLGASHSVVVTLASGPPQ